MTPTFAHRGTDEYELTGQELEQEIQNLTSRLSKLRALHPNRGGHRQRVAQASPAGVLPAMILTVAALVVTVLNLSGHGPTQHGVGGLTSYGTSELQMRQAADYAQRKVDRYAEVNGRLPRSSSELGLASEDGFDLEMVGQRSYRIVVNRGDAVYSVVKHVHPTSTR